MTNPAYNQDSIKKMKRPGVAIDGNDASVLAETIGVHNTTPPTLDDGDFKQTQLDDLGNTLISFGDPAQVIELKTANIFPVPMGWKRKLDYGARTDGQPEYIGLALMATADATAEWYIFKFTYTSDFNTLTESAYGAWNGRALLF